MLHRDCKLHPEVGDLLKQVVAVFEQVDIPFTVVWSADNVADVRAALDKLEATCPPLVN